MGVIYELNLSGLWNSLHVRNFVRISSLIVSPAGRLSGTSVLDTFLGTIIVEYSVKMI